MSRRGQPTPETAAPEVAVEEAVEEAQEEAGETPEAPDIPQPSLPSQPERRNSETPSDSSENRRLQLLHENLSLVLTRHDQQAHLMARLMDQMSALMGEMRNTIELHQQVVSAADQQHENLGLATQALTRVEQRFATHLAEVREHLNNYSSRE